MKRSLVLLVAALLVSVVSAQDSSDVNYVAAVKLLKDGNVTVAVTLLEAALEKNPESPKICYALGVACERLGKKDQAVTYYRRAVLANRTKSKEPDEAALALKRLFIFDPDAVFLLTQADNLIDNAKERSRRVKAAMQVAADGLVAAALLQPVEERESEPLIVGIREIKPHAVEGRWYYTTPKATYYREYKNGILKKFIDADFETPTAVFTYKVLDDKTVLVDDGEKCTLLGEDSLDYGGNTKGTRIKAEK